MKCLICKYFFSFEYGGRRRGLRALHLNQVCYLFCFIRQNIILLLINTYSANISVDYE